MNKKVATTVKVDITLYDEFKVLGVRHKTSLQGLVEKTVYRYVHDGIFRDEINNFFVPIIATTITSSITSSFTLS